MLNRQIIMKPVRYNGEEHGGYDLVESEWRFLSFYSFADQTSFNLKNWVYFIWGTQIIFEAIHVSLFFVV